MTTTQTKCWDTIAQRYVERTEWADNALETFGVLPLASEAPANDNATVPEYANDNVPVARQQERGPWVLLYRGRRFYPFDPRPEDVRIDAIAHGLAMSSRYNGAGDRYYTTAEHSVHIYRWLVAQNAPLDTRLIGLLHDSPEPLSGFGDVLRPVKDRAPIIRDTEANIWRNAIAPAFELPVEIPSDVHLADNLIIHDEMRQNMAEVDPGYETPLGVTLEFWPQEKAELEFLRAFYTVQRQRQQQQRRVAA